jgi:para-aminobenzoate synthetase component I
LNRSFVSFPIPDVHRIKKQVLDWANQFNICCFLDNHHYASGYKQYQCIAGIGTLDSIKASAGNALPQLQLLLDKHRDWVFGHLGYDLKNETEQQASRHPDLIGFPDLCFFIPEIVLLIKENEIQIGCTQPGQATAVFQAITNIAIEQNNIEPTAISIQSRLSKEEYIHTIERLQQHIVRGDCYEINYCQEFFSENAFIDPVRLYHSLSALSPSPFAAYYKVENSYLVCASPERFLKKEGRQLISQPIKGTAKRMLHNPTGDALNKQGLKNSKKDQSENVMVVDLVRNDLSKICLAGTVTVDELYGIYSFPQVYQMISTISGQLKPGVSFASIIQQTFPMGSMTGAPKRKVLELIERYEVSRRGIFSAALGFIDPEGNFDFNVVIRSILYNKASAYLSYLAGSGITFYSNAEEEYEECLLKAMAIKKLLK